MMTRGNSTRVWEASAKAGWRALATALVAIAVSAVAGCMAYRPPAAPTLAQKDAGPAGTSGEPYRLQVGDQLSIRFYNNPELDQDVVVRPDGMISVPFLDDVRAAGLTPAELDAELTRGYTGELATPNVTIIVTQFAGHRVYVGGEVANQGVVPISGGMTMFQAIQEAGGFLTTAHRKQVILIRKGPDGKPVGRSVDLKSVQTGRHPENDVLLQPYDIVFVPRSKVANVALFVQQYLRDALPVQPFLGFNLF